MIKKLLCMALLTLSLYAQDKPLTHVVLCWMDSTMSETEINSLIEETKELKQINGIGKLTVGRPVPSDRPIVDDSFTFGITMSFENRTLMNSYLKDEKHTSFVASNIKPNLVKLLVYDIEAQ